MPQWMSDRFMAPRTYDRTRPCLYLCLLLLKCACPDPPLFQRSFALFAHPSPPPALGLEPCRFAVQLSVSIPVIVSGALTCGFIAHLPVPLARLLIPHFTRPD